MNKKIITCIAYLLCVPLLQADVVSRRLSLMAATGQTTSTNGAITTFAEPKPTPIISKIICSATAANVSGTLPTLDIKIQNCRDATASNCDDICTFTQCSSSATTCWTDGTQSIDLVTGNFFPYFRAVTTVGGTLPNFNVSVDIYY